MRKRNVLRLFYLRFNYLQVSHLYSTCREVWNFEFDTDRSLALPSLCPSHASAEPSGHATTMFVVALDTREAKFSSHEELLATAKLLDLPYDSRLLRCIVDGANVRSKAWRVCIIGHRNENLDIIGRRAPLELGLGLYT